MFRLVFLVLSLAVTTALQWSSDLPDQTVVTTCSGSDIHLPWNFTLSTGQRVEDIKWLYQAQGRDEEVIAVFAAGNFLIMPAFSGRVQRIGEGGIVVNKVGLLESGNYSVVVSIYDTANTFEKQQRTAYVQVADFPTTESGRLHTQQKSGAVYDNATGEWHVQLTCGKFSFLGHPGVQVVWTSPEGHPLSSSAIHNGTFHLLVPNLPTSGNYTCTLPPLSPATHCLPPLSPLREGASVAVDGVKASFTLLAAKQEEIQTQMQAENDRLRADVEALKKDNEQTKNESRQENDLLKGEVASLRSQLSNATQQIGFHARLPRDIQISSGDSVKPWHIITNQGQGFNAATGEFAAPVDGFFFFVASSGPAAASYSAHLSMKKDGVIVSETFVTRYSSYWSMGSCHATEHLLKGQQMWLSANNDGNFDGQSTSFSGFLINADA